MQHKFPIFSHDVNEQSIHACGRSAIIILFSFYSVRYVDVVSVQFLARDSIYAIARSLLTPVRLSVCLSVRPVVRHTGGSVKDGYS